MSEQKAARKRFVGLDFLKAVAAIFIVMHHYQQASGVIFTTFNFYPASDAQLHLGFLTILFFMISGFLVEWQQQQEERVGKQTSLPGKLWHKCLTYLPNGDDRLCRVRRPWNFGLAYYRQVELDYGGRWNLDILL